MEKEEDEMLMIPVVDMGECTDCGSCLEVCPEVFKRNLETGNIDVADLNTYPEDCVQEAISVCPVDCISWEESGGTSYI
jgi:ferredoxin